MERMLDKPVGRRTLVNFFTPAVGSEEGAPNLTEVIPDGGLAPYNIISFV